MTISGSAVGGAAPWLGLPRSRLNAGSRLVPRGLKTGFEAIVRKWFQLHLGAAEMVFREKTVSENRLAEKPVPGAVMSALGAPRANAYRRKLLVPGKSPAGESLIFLGLRV